MLCFYVCHRPNYVLNHKGMQIALKWIRKNKYLITTSRNTMLILFLYFMGGKKLTNAAFKWTLMLLLCLMSYLLLLALLLSVKQSEWPDFLGCKRYSVSAASRRACRSWCSFSFPFSCCVLIHCCTTSVGNCFLSVRTFIADAVNMPAGFTITKADWKTPGACCF